jgi:N4-gp56 family major capsid protein
MAVDTFVPEIWSAELQTTLPTLYVFGQPGVINRDYEGDISQFGDTVHIGKLTDPSIRNYTKNTTITVDTLATTDQALLIDQAKYFAFQIDDVDARQVRDDGQLMDKAAQRSAAALAAAADAYVSGLMVAGAGTILTPAAVGSVDAAYLLVRTLRVKLDKNNVPVEGRFLIVSPEFYALILGDNRFINAQAYGSTDGIRNGEVGTILGFSVLVSNTIPAGTAATAPAVSNFVIAGHNMATTFADQINSVEAYRSQNAFSDTVRGLHLYGAKVVRPEALVVQDTDVTIV